MSDEQVVGIPLLAAAAISAPPRRFALLVAYATYEQAMASDQIIGNPEEIFPLAEKWAAWLEGGEVGPGPADQLGEDPDYDMTTMTRPGVPSFGRP